MPNAQNVQAPLTLLSYGRSGTSLLHKIFELHSQFEAAGETTDLIFGTWHAAEYSNPVIRWQPGSDGSPLGVEQRCAATVRAALCAMLPSDRPRWMHKPIGLPGLRPYPKPEDQKPPEDFIGDFPATWYWKVLKATFPQSRYFIALRHPCDVVLSSKQYWGWAEARIWHFLGRHARLMMHPLSMIEYGVSYDRLTRDPEQQLRLLLERFDIAWEPRILNAMNELHVPAQGRERADPGPMSRRDDWHLLSPDDVTTESLEAIAALWARHGLDFGLPPQLMSRAGKQ